MYFGVGGPGIGRTEEVLVLNVDEPLCRPDQLDVRSVDALLDHPALLHLGWHRLDCNVLDPGGFFSYRKIVCLPSLVREGCRIVCDRPVIEGMKI